MHGGWLRNIDQTTGRLDLPATGAIVGGQVSVTSFFFGDGARFLSPTVTPLDTVLRSRAFAWQQQTGTAGVRVSHAVRHRMMVEFSGDYNRATMSPTGAVLTGIDSTRASVTRALQQVLSAGSVASTVSSAVTSTKQDGFQLTTTASVVFDLKESGRAIPYVTGGGGVLFNNIDAASVNVTGRYELGTPAQIFGADSVTIRSPVNTFEYLGMGGAGVKYYVTPRWGVRFEGRARVYPNKIDTLVGASPVVTLRSAGSPYPLIDIGALQFSSTAPLTGAPVADFVTFKGRRLRAQASAVAGVFWRF